MKRIIVTLIILSAFLNFANAQDRATTPPTYRGDLREIITTKEFPKEIIIDRSNSPKTVTIDTGVPGEPPIDIKIEAVEGGDKAKITIKKGQISLQAGQKGKETGLTIQETLVPYRPTEVKPMDLSSTTASDAMSFIGTSAIYPLIEKAGAKLSESDITFVNYDKKGFSLINFPILKDGKPTDSFVVVYKFARADASVLFRFPGKREVELVDGKTGQKTTLEFTPEGQLKTGSAKSSWLFPSFVGNAYAFNWERIDGCIAHLLKRAPEWGPMCSGCLVGIIGKKFQKALCMGCVYELMGIVGTCYRMLIE